MTATTRRALFGVTVALTAIPAASIAAIAKAKPSLTKDQIRLAEWLKAVWGDVGLRTAQTAITAGFGYADVECAGYNSPDRATRRLTVYVTDGKRTRAYSEAGEHSAT